MGTRKDKTAVSQWLENDSPEAKIYRQYEGYERSALVRRGIVLAHQEQQGKQTVQQDAMFTLLSQCHVMLSNMKEYGLQKTGGKKEEERDEIPEELGI